MTCLRWVVMLGFLALLVAGCSDSDRRMNPPPARDLSGNWQVKEAFCEETAAGVGVSADQFQATLLDFDQAEDGYLWVENVHRPFMSREGSVAGDRVSFVFRDVLWGSDLVAESVSFDGSVAGAGRIDGDFKVRFRSGEVTCGADLYQLEEPTVYHGGDWVLVEDSDVACTVDVGGWDDPAAETARLKGELEAASDGASFVWQLDQDPEGNAIRGRRYDSAEGYLTGYVEGDGIHFYPIPDDEGCSTAITGTYDDVGAIHFLEARRCFAGDIAWDRRCSYTVEAK